MTDEMTIQTSLEDARPPAACGYECAALYTGVSIDTLKRYVRSGTLPHVRVGTRIVLLYKDLDAFLQSRRSTEWKPDPKRISRSKTDD